MVFSQYPQLINHLSTKMTRSILPHVAFVASQWVKPLKGSWLALTQTVWDKAKRKDLGSCNFILRYYIGRPKHDFSRERENTIVTMLLFPSYLLVWISIYNIVASGSTIKRDNKYKIYIFDQPAGSLDNSTLLNNQNHNELYKRVIRDIYPRQTTGGNGIPRRFYESKCGNHRLVLL
jgi:hypothetical protein